MAVNLGSASIGYATSTFKLCAEPSQIPSGIATAGFSALTAIPLGSPSAKATLSPPVMTLTGATALNAFKAGKIEPKELGKWLGMVNQLNPLPSSKEVLTGVAKFNELPDLLQYPTLESAFKHGGLDIISSDLKEFQKESVLKKIIFNTKNLKSAEAFAFKIRRPSQEMTGGSGDVSGGPALPANRANLIDRKNDCLRPYRPSDESSMLIEFVASVDNFREAAMILTYSADGWTRTCSAVMIHKEYALTAAHCLTGPGTVNTRTNLISETLVLVPNGPVRTADQPRRIEDCHTSKPTLCDYAVGRLVGASLLGSPTMASVAFGTQTAFDVPAPDLGLLKIAFAQGTTVTAAVLQPKRIEDKAFTDSAPLNLTRAGYGIRDSNSSIPQKLPILSVGYWHSEPGKKPKLAKYNRLYVPHPAAASKICEFDSGGAVFADSYSGGELERRKLIGVISAGQGRVFTPKGCANSEAELLQLIDATILDEICAKTKEAVCPSTTG